MSVILLVDGLHELYAGTAGGGQVTALRSFCASNDTFCAGKTVSISAGASLRANGVRVVIVLCIP
ncbi:MAG: hypothetical protein ACK541_01650 [Burkholderiales bacterium]